MACSYVCVLGSSMVVNVCRGDDMNGVEVTIRKDAPRSPLLWVGVFCFCLGFFFAWEHAIFCVFLISDCSVLSCDVRANYKICANIIS